MKSFLRMSAVAVAAAALLFTAPARAQRWVPTGISELASGVEGGGGRSASMGLAAPRITVGADMFVDESPEDVFGGAAAVAVGPRTAFGLEGRYTRLVGKLAFTGGVLGWLQPGSLVGPKAAIELRQPFAKSFTFAAGPELDVFVLGTDLPDKTVLWQAMFHVGLRVAF